MRSDAASDNSAGSLASGSAVSLGGSVLGAVLNLGLVLVVAWGFAPDQAGVIFEAAALFNILVVVTTFGADTGIVRYVARRVAEHRTDLIPSTLVSALVPTIVLASVVGIAVYASAELIGEVFASDNPDELADFARAAAYAVPFGAGALVLLGATRGLGTMAPTAIQERILRPAAQLAAIALGIAASTSWFSIGALWAVAYPLIFVSASVSLRRLTSSSVLHPRRPTRTDFFEFWTFSLPRALAAVFRVGVLYLDVLLVGALIDARAAAIYTVATRLLQMGFMVNNALGQAAEPIFARQLTLGQHDAANHSFKMATGWNIGATWPWLLTIAVFSNPVLEVFGAEFSEARTTVLILALGGLVAVAVGPVDVLLVMSGRSGLSFVNSALALTTNVVLNVLLLPLWGLEGAAVAWVVSLLISNVLPLIQVRILLRLTPLGQGWTASVVTSLGFFGAGALAWNWAVGDDVRSLAFFLTLATPGYALVMWHQRERLDLASFRMRPAPQPTPQIPAT